MPQNRILLVTWSVTNAQHHYKWSLSVMTQTRMVINEGIWTWGSNGLILQRAIIITEDNLRNLSLILLPLPGWLWPLTTMTPEPWPLTSRQLQWLYSLSCTTTTKLFVLNLCEQNTMLWVNKGKRKTQHPHNKEPQRCLITLTLKEEKTTTLHDFRRMFSFPSSKKCQGSVSNNCCNHGDYPGLFLLWRCPAVCGVSVSSFMFPYVFYMSIDTTTGGQWFQ